MADSAGKITSADIIQRLVDSDKIKVDGIQEIIDNYKDNSE